MYPVYHEMDITHFTDRMDALMANVDHHTRLRSMRLNCRLSQSELAAASGVALRQIQLFEQRQRNINNASATTLLQLSKPLHCRMEDLIEYNWSSQDSRHIPCPDRFFNGHLDIILSFFISWKRYLVESCRFGTKPWEQPSVGQTGLFIASAVYFILKCWSSSRRSVTFISGMPILYIGTPPLDIIRYPTDNSKCQFITSHEKIRYERIFILHLICFWCILWAKSIV